MPYTKAVIYETMRCVNFVPLSVPRVATKDIEIGGYLIPKVKFLNILQCNKC